MPDKETRSYSGREEQIFDEAAETPSRAIEAAAPGGTMTSNRAEASRDSGGAELRIDETPDAEGKLPPPSAHRADTMVRAVAPDARQEMEHNGVFQNQASFTKGVNAPTVDQSRYPYTTEQMDELMREAPQGLFPDTPGGDGATPLSADRQTFLRMMGDKGRFPSQRETEKWARAVFNALRHRALEKDEALILEMKTVVRFGEAPEVQVEEMMWGGDFVDRMSRLVTLLNTWPKREFYEQVAEEGGETVDDPWVDAAVHSFLGTLKVFLDGTADRLGNLGEMQQVWDTV
jgi:hypothetical protein